LEPKEIATLSAAEKEDFAEKLLQAEDHMYRDRTLERSKDGEGKITVGFRKGDVVLPRNPGESATEYFKRTYMRYQDETAKKIARMIAPQIDFDNVIKKLTGWAKPSALDALSANAAISDSLSKKIAALRLLEIPAFTSLHDSLHGLSGLKIPAMGLGIPGVNGPGSTDDDSTPTELPRALSSDVIKALRSPVYDTNERLDNLIERFDRFEGIAVETVELVKTMNDAASGLLQSFGEGAKSTEQYARRSIRIAVIALMAAILIPAFQLGCGIWQSHHQDDETRAIVEAIVRRVTSSQQEASNGIREAIANQADRVHLDQTEITKAVTALGDVLRVLNERLPKQPEPSGPTNHSGN
jgi:hypothetical protein